MEQHHGQILEKVIRRNGYSISEIARLVKVDRRSVYNWFNHKSLKSDIIYRIGSALNYDFSTEFPKMFVADDLARPAKHTLMPITDIEPPAGSNDQTRERYWKDKYITLLEEYTSLLRSFAEVKRTEMFRNNAC